METENADVLCGSHRQRVDLIVFVGPILSSFDVVNDEQLSSTRVADLWSIFEKEIIPTYGITLYPTGKGLRRVFCYTLIAGLDDTGHSSG